MPNSTKVVNPGPGMNYLFVALASLGSPWGWTSALRAAMAPKMMPNTWILQENHARSCLNPSKTPPPLSTHTHTHRCGRDGSGSSHGRSVAIVIPLMLVELLVLEVHVDVHGPLAGGACSHRACPDCGGVGFPAGPCSGCADLCKHARHGLQNMYTYKPPLIK